ncbi:hypothetical protein [Archangium sp.]|uniref:hypothetical protein n=1 Tax=Archangium sp. TaxID=1872627 RepID=UPI002D6DB6D7|nr:hypothetical protein [Archangium sp.]HYO51606.1 hypothetical protein [Archangium sp.]
MSGIRTANAREPNAQFHETSRARGQSNLTWLERALEQLPKELQSGPSLLLLGGRDPISFRLREAQSHVRHDLTPSYWSHVVLLERSGPTLSALEAWEISLNPAHGFGYPPKTNGIQRADLNVYADADRFPNVSVVHVPLELHKVKAARERFMSQRAVVDAVDLLTEWLSYCWATGRKLNPLLEGHGLPSAAMVEVIMGAAGFELTPSIASRSSSPEAIWQSARWWHEYHGTDSRQPLSGTYHTSHSLCMVD